MAVVRELITRLGFTFDNTNLNKFERSILGFKTKFSLAAGAIGVAFAKVINYATEFSDGLLKTNAVAQFTRTSVKELNGLKNAFQKFDVNPETFLSAVSNISKGISDSVYGVDNEIRQLAITSRGAVTNILNGQVVSVRQFIEMFRNYVNTLETETGKLNLIQRIFGVDEQTSVALRNIFAQTNQAWNALIEKEIQAGHGIEGLVDKARNFKSELNGISVEWKKFSDKVAGFFLPILTGILGGANKLIQEIPKKGLDFGVNSILKGIETGVNSFFSLFNQKKENRPLESLNSDIYSRIQMQQERAAMNNNLSSINATTNINVNVPPTTSSLQASEISDSIKNAMDGMWDEKIRELNTNSPQYE